MLKYCLVALALKASSLNSTTRSLYRRLGNSIGARRRAMWKVPGYYFNRVERNLRWCARYGPLLSGDFLAEIGTGWVHWEALTLRLFYDFHAVLYDVWDNRQLDALKNYLRQLRERFGKDGYLQEYDLERASWHVDKIEQISSFEGLYRLLGFRYVLEPSGTLQCLDSGRFRVTVSAAVMEHIDAATAPIFVGQLGRITAPGGIASHSINIGDHLTNYDCTMSDKEYLRFSESTWKRWYENQVQYINLIQRGDWLRYFDNAGLHLVEEDSSYTDISKLWIAPQFQHLSKQ